MITAPHQFLSCSRFVGPSIEPKQKQTILTCLRNKAQAAIGLSLFIPARDFKFVQESYRTGRQDH
jgi:hypothetical protein